MDKNISKKTIAILMPGDMGHGCGQAFKENGFNVVSCLNQRSERTKKLAYAAGIEDLKTIDNVIEASDLILSILPPESALKQAEAINSKILKLKKKNYLCRL
jgi:ketol-acid reductoisomerase